MIIQNSEIHLSAEHQRSEITERSLSGPGFALAMLDAEMSFSQNRFSAQLAQGQLGSALTPAGAAGSAEPASHPFRLLPTAFPGRFSASPTQASSEELQSSLMQSRIRFFQALIDALTGRSHQIEDPDAEAESTDPLLGEEPGESGNLPTSDAATSPIPGQPVLNPLVLEIDVRVSQYHKETETTNFSACGMIQTCDGQSIELNLNLEMSRSYESISEFETKQQVVFKDPLVVNFNGTAAELSDEKYQFDLDVDGELDWIHFTDINSGLLALDKNEDGQINDGSELFGAISGDGFADLRQYDLDQNGWIDEADAVFDDLKIWTRQDEQDQLTSLLDRNIGAIYLRATETPFELKDEANNLQGRVRQSGVYLNEDGGVGTVQQIDMVV
ncbi:hypothetical protein [Motiliproteus sp.]|uniref:hypothetical protein n=1 Tax=Motiliproteus sp. TaxID=1898955 RepID=UPI003BAAF476